MESRQIAPFLLPNPQTRNVQPNLPGQTLKYWRPVSTVQTESITTRFLQINDGRGHAISNNLSRRTHFEATTHVLVQAFYILNDNPLLIAKCTLDDKSGVVHSVKRLDGCMNFAFVVVHFLLEANIFFDGVVGKG